MIKNLELVRNKNALIINSLRLCPFNFEPYKMTINLHLMNQEFIEIIRYCDLTVMAVSYVESLLKDKGIKGKELYVQNEYYFSLIEMLDGRSKEDLLLAIAKRRYQQCIDDIVRMHDNSKSSELYRKKEFQKNVLDFGHTDNLVSTMLGTDEDMQYIFSQTNWSILGELANRLNYTGVESISELDKYFSVLNKTNNEEIDSILNRIEDEEIQKQTEELERKRKSIVRLIIASCLFMVGKDSKSWKKSTGRSIGKDWPKIWKSLS